MQSVENPYCRLSTKHIYSTWQQNTLKVSYKSQFAKKRLDLADLTVLFDGKTLTFLSTTQDESIDRLSAAPQGAGLRVWETKAEAYMAVQQIRL